MDKFGFTLLEVMVVIIIIGILATIGLVNYTGTKEHALGKEAQANLKLIAAAEKIYRLETTDYYLSTDMAAINANLKLAFPTANYNWNYAITGTTGVTDAFTATASRAGAATDCVYKITNALDDPIVDTGTCP